MNRPVYLAKRLLLLPVLAGLVTACSPVRYVQMQPVSGPVATVDGRLVTKASADSIEVVASFEREDMTYLAFDVEIKNRSDVPIDVDPANFRATLFDSDRQPLTEVGTVNFRNAADPDFEAGKVAYAIDREETRVKRARLINTVLVAAAIVGTVAAVASTPSSRNKNPRQEYLRRVNTQVVADLAFNTIQAKRVIDHSLFANRMQRYQFEQYRWRELALKRTVVPPGESVRGYVYLPGARQPRARQAAYIDLTYPLPSGNAIAIQFEQLLVTKRPR